jgi:hypothetical protein
MAATTFTDGVTLIVSAWLNDVDSATYDNFGDGTSYTGRLTIADTTNATSTTTGSSKNAGGSSIVKDLWVGGLANIAGAATVTGGIVLSGGNANPINASGAGTNSTLFAIANTGGTHYLGAESSVGGATFTGSTAYATIIGTSAARSLQLVTNNTVRQTIDSSGNQSILGTLAVGTTVTSTIAGYFVGTAAITPFTLAGSGGTMVYSGAGNLVVAAGENAANAFLFVRKDNTTNRSINAAGTINASGADGAEYHRKAPGCGRLVAGQIAGRDKNGLLTDKWSECV